MPPLGDTKHDLGIPIPAAGSYMGPFNLPTAELETLPAPGGAGVTYLPFSISDSSTTTSAKITVTSGFVGTAMSATSSYTITDIDTSLPIDVDNFIYLKATVSSLAVTALTVIVDDGTLWPEYPVLYGFDGTPAQDVFYVLIGYVWATPADPANTPGFPITISSSDYWVYQRLRTDLMIENLCGNGIPIIYPYAFSGPVV